MGLPLQMELSTMEEESFAQKRDYNAGSRLLAQHHMWKSELGYLIHPSIPVPPQPRIADVATGNGCWLLDVASHVAEPYNLHGFDSSLDQTPITAIDPTSFSSIRFHSWDVLEDPPKAFIGAFDVVHVRLILVGLSEEGPAITVVEGLKKLLKPGGYLQWEEIDSKACKVVPPASGGEAPAMMEALGQIAGTIKGEWKQNGAKMLNDHGFFNAQQYHLDSSENLGRFWTDIYLGHWADFVANVLDDPDKAKKVGDEAMREARKGAVIQCPMWVWVAQKAPAIPDIPEDVPHGTPSHHSFSRPASRNGLPNNHVKTTLHLNGNSSTYTDPRSPVRERPLSVHSSLATAAIMSNRLSISAPAEGSIYESPVSNPNRRSMIATPIGMYPPSNANGDRTPASLPPTPHMIDHARAMSPQTIGVPPSPTIAHPERTSSSPRHHMNNSLNDQGPTISRQPPNNNSTPRILTSPTPSPSPSPRTTYPTYRTTPRIDPPPPVRDREVPQDREMIPVGSPHHPTHNPNASTNNNASNNGSGEKNPRRNTMNPHEAKNKAGGAHEKSEQGNESSSSTAGAGRPSSLQRSKIYRSLRKLRGS